jgi:hypothetical protein
MAPGGSRIGPGWIVVVAEAGKDHPPMTEGKAGLVH